MTTMSVGRLVWFILLRGGVEIYRDPSAVEHKDDNAIQPYETYIYRLRVCNGVGCIDSAPVSHSRTTTLLSDRVFCVIFFPLFVLLFRLLVRCSYSVWYFILYCVKTDAPL